MSRLSYSTLKGGMFPGGISKFILPVVGHAPGAARFHFIVDHIKKLIKILRGLL